MKHVIVLTIALFTGIANARSMMMPTASVDQISTNISSATLYPNGTLLVINRRGLKQSVKLAPTVFSELQGLAQSLEQAEVVTTHKDIVCMMVPNPFTRRDLSVGMRLVLSAQGCAYPDITHPKEEYAKEMARSLREQIVLLARQALQD